MSHTAGRRLPLARSRRLTCDVVHYHRQVPTCAHDRRCDLSRLVSLRARLPRRVSWSLLFVKAYALVAREHPVLRQTFLRWPWPHVYESAESVAMVVVQRMFQGEPWLFWGRFTQPDAQPLIDLQDQLEQYQQAPVEQVFERQWQLSAFPTPVRRLFWWWTLNVSGAKRAKRTGTFFLTTIAAHGAEIQHPPAFLTGNLTYGPLDEQGHSRVTLAYDHRLMDGLTVARALSDLEATLNGPIAAELEQLAARRDAA